MTNSLCWAQIFRLGLIQTSLGAIIVLTTSTLNRVMVVEFALPAMLPGFLVTIHHVVQLARPRIGHGSDVGGRRTPWILGGMMVLALGGVLAALGTTFMPSSQTIGTTISAVGFFAIGLGSGATGTSLLVLLAKLVSPERKPAAAALVWFMMIFGFAVTAGIAGYFLDPFSSMRLMTVTACVSLIALVVTILAVRGIEPTEQATAQSTAPAVLAPDPPTGHAPIAFSEALQSVWREDDARRFTIFVFVSMFAYSAQDLILEPFAGLVFNFSPGASTQLAGLQHGGVLAGMALVALTTLSHRYLRGVNWLSYWVRGGCLLSACALFLLAYSGNHPANWPLQANVLLLGFANGAFAVAAIGAMMTLAGQGIQKREGLRMGLWGAAQAIAFAIGGFLGTVAVDATRIWIDDSAVAYGLVFAAEGLMFLWAAWLAGAIKFPVPESHAQKPSFGDIALNELGDKGATT
jgi:BCD family chlorophyll transporter-like MFS transporter